MSTVSIGAPLQIICEGTADEAFFIKLLSARGINDFEVRCAKTVNEPERCAGKTGFTDTLHGLLSIGILKPHSIKGILLALDSDNDPIEAFTEARQVWKSCRPMRPHPDKALEIRDDNPAMSILTIPWVDRTGNLDTLLYEAARSSHGDIITPVEEFCGATEHRNGEWSSGKRDKMKLRCVIAASHKSDPGLSLHWLIKSHECPFDFGCTAFDRIATFLAEFRETVLASASD